MSATSNDLSKPPETNAAGTVTEWAAIPTAFPLQEGCGDALISARSGNLTGWDPGYAITVDASVKCWPSEATTWWNQGDPRTTISLGPVICPEAYYTAAISVKDESSTLVACCPSDYTYMNDAAISIVAPRSQCVSFISEGQIFNYASDFEGDAGWLKTSATATAATSVIGIPFNGWQFRLATTAALASTSSASNTATPAPETTSGTTSLLPTSSSTTLPTPESLGIPSDELSTRAKVGIGVGVGIGVLLAIGILLWVFLDPLARIRHRRNADRVEAASRAQGRGRSPEPGPYASPTPPSLREMVLGSPTPPSLSPGWEDRPREMSPLPPSEVLSMSSGGGGQPRVEPRDMITYQYHEDAAPAPVVGGIGVGRSGSAQSRRGASSSLSHRRNQYSASEWIVTPGQPPHVQPAHGRSGSQQSLYAIGAHPRPSGSTVRSARSGPAIGLWGIDPTGGAGRSDQGNRPSDLGKRPDRSEMVSPPARSDSVSDPARNESTTSMLGGLGVAGPSGTTASAIGRSSSQRSARIITSPIEMAGQRYEMALELPYDEVDDRQRR